MSNAFVERRRFPRVAVASDGPTASLPSAVSVQILDISQSGALLGSAQRIEPGRRAQLRTRIGAEPLAMPVAVRRVTSDFSQPSGGGFRLGVEFVALDNESRRKLERLVRAEQ